MFAPIRKLSLLPGQIGSPSPTFKLMVGKSEPLETVRQGPAHGYGQPDLSRLNQLGVRALADSTGIHVLRGLSGVAVTALEELGEAALATCLESVMRGFKENRGKAVIEVEGVHPLLIASTMSAVAKMYKLWSIADSFSREPTPQSGYGVEWEGGLVRFIQKRSGLQSAFARDNEGGPAIIF